MASAASKLSLIIELVHGHKSAQEDNMETRMLEHLKEIEACLKTTHFVNYIAVSKLPCMTCRYFIKTADSVWPIGPPPQISGSHGKWCPNFLPEELFDLLDTNFASEVYIDLLNRFRRCWGMLNDANACLDEDTASSSSIGSAIFPSYPPQSDSSEVFMASEPADALKSDREVSIETPYWGFSNARLIHFG
ncbi:MAG: hypothetical protein MMC33_000745 [Icmadophila ericetorum]|nr:hypothetical protein [Icmadophila ericetorum]